MYIIMHACFALRTAVAIQCIPCDPLQAVPLPLVACYAVRPSNACKGLSKNLHASRELMAVSQASAYPAILKHGWHSHSVRHDCLALATPPQACLLCIGCTCRGATLAGRCHPISLVVCQQAQAPWSVHLWPLCCTTCSPSSMHTARRAAALQGGCHSVDNRAFIGWAVSVLWNHAAAGAGHLQQCHDHHCHVQGRGHARRARQVLRVLLAWCAAPG